jgi:hypothetical protein
MVTAEFASWAFPTAPVARFEVCTTPAASFAEVTAPSAIFPVVMAPSLTLSAIIAYPTAAMRRSGVSCWKPFTPSLNQTRRWTSPWVKTVAGTMDMCASVASPSRTAYRPLLTGMLMAVPGSLPAVLEPSLLQ